MKTHKKYYPSNVFSGEKILAYESYNTYEEAKANTNLAFPDVDWEEYDEKNRFVTSSYEEWRSSHWVTGYYD